MKSMVNPYLEYQSNNVNTADARELVVMLYDGAIRFLEEGKQFMENFRTYDKANGKILRAQDILTELMVSLDLDQGGEIAQNLLNLYSFMKKQLLEANVKKDPSMIAPVIKMLRDLKETWEKLDADAASKPAVETPRDYKGGFVARG